MTLLAAIPLLLPGTPVLYNGEEIGMQDNTLISLDEFKDQLALWMYRSEIEIFHTSLSRAYEAAILYGRDKSRTPMQWSQEPNAGFCPRGVRPWLPVNPDYILGINVEVQKQVESSPLQLYRQLISLRKKYPALAGGDYQVLLPEHPDCLAFLRKNAEAACLVLMNMSDHPLSFQAGELPGNLQCVFSSEFSDKNTPCKDMVELHPYEVRVFSLSASGIN